MNGAGGNLIKNLLRVALRSNHTVKSFWFWSTSNTLKSWQFSPAQACFHRCAGMFFLLRSPGESGTTQQPGPRAPAVPAATPWLEGIRSLLSTQALAGLAPSLSLDCWDGRETAWTQHWARGNCWQTPGKSGEWLECEVRVGRSRGICRKRYFINWTFGRDCFSPSKTFYVENVIVKLPREDWGTTAPVASWKSPSTGISPSQAEIFPQDHTDGESCCAGHLSHIIIWHNHIISCLIIIWHQQLAPFRVHHLLLYGFKNLLKLFNFRPRDLEIPSQAASLCSINPSDIVFEQEQGDGSLKSLRWGKKKERRFQYHQCHQWPWVISKA